MQKDYFAGKAQGYDQQNRDRGDIADAILERIPLDKTLHVLDFGSGTGLLLQSIAPFVGRMTAVDMSPAMNRQLAEKRSQLPCALEIVEADLEQTDLPGPYDGVISSMAMHHVRDVQALLVKFARMLKPGGFIAIADLDKEDGGFHTEDTGVYHFGFERPVIEAAARNAGFRDVATTTASMIRKSQGDYPVFLLTGTI